MGKIITALNSLNRNSIDRNDLLYITDLSEYETKNMTAEEYAQYCVSSSNVLANSKTGSFTGSFYGIHIGDVEGTSSWATNAVNAKSSSHLVYPNNSTASYALNSKSSSYSDFALSSSNAATASYALNANIDIPTGEGFEEEFTYVSHSFLVGDLVTKISASFVLSSFITASTSEVYGIIKSKTANTFTVVTFGKFVLDSVPSYGPFVDGTTYFLSSSGKASSTDPISDGYVSKPIFIATHTSSGMMINSRGIVFDYSIFDTITATGSLSASYARTSTSASNAVSASYAVTCSYFAGIGSGGSSVPSAAGGLVSLNYVVKKNSFAANSPSVNLGGGLVKINWVDIPDLSFSITPKSINSKFVISLNTIVKPAQISIQYGSIANLQYIPLQIGLFRDATRVGVIGPVDPLQVQRYGQSTNYSIDNGNGIMNLSKTFMDIPSVDSLITFSVKIRALYIGNNFNNTNQFTVNPAILIDNFNAFNAIFVDDDGTTSNGYDVGIKSYSSLMIQEFDNTIGSPTNINGTIVKINGVLGSYNPNVPPEL